MSPLIPSETAGPIHAGQTTNLCQLEESCNNQLDPSPTRVYSTTPSLMSPIHRSNDSDAAECKLRASKVDDCSCKSDSIISSGECASNGVIDEENIVTGALLHSESSTFGSLCYEPPVMDHCDTPIDDAMYNLMQQSNNSKMLMSPINCFTSPFMNSASSTLGSILNNAAESFSSTPSILRKRKKGTAGLKILCSSCTPKESESVDANQGQEGSSKASNTETPCYDNRRDEPCIGKSFNASPPYRLKYKRTAISKTVERKLQFTFDKENFEADSNSICLNANVFGTGSPDDPVKMRDEKLDENLAVSEGLKSESAHLTETGVT
ncbi:Transcription factor myb3r-5 [Asimina triloba]